MRLDLCLEPWAIGLQLLFLSLPFFHCIVPFCNFFANLSIAYEGDICAYWALGSRYHLTDSFLFWLIILGFCSSLYFMCSPLMSNKWRVLWGLQELPIPAVNHRPRLHFFSLAYPSPQAPTCSVSAKYTIWENFTMIVESCLPTIISRWKFQKWTNK